MDNISISPRIRKYLLELINRNTLSINSFNDQTLLNFMNEKKFDEDYLFIRRSFPYKYKSDRKIG